MSTTDQVLLGQIQDALLEPRDGGQSWPSGLWTREEMLHYCNQRQDSFLWDTFALVGIAATIAVGIGVHRIALPVDWLHTMTVLWRGSDGTVRELLRGDSFEADMLIPTWESTNAASPLQYHDEETPSGFFQIAPAPSVTGTVELLYIPLGTELNGNGEILVVPDELSHAVKYGAMADALGKDGRGKDPGRAQYCEQRYDLAVQLTEIILQGWA